MNNLSYIWPLAWHMLVHNRSRLSFTVLGVSAAFFLAAAQFGLLVAWVNITTALIKHADVDLWIMAEKTQALDFGLAIPRQYVYRARSMPGVAWAQPLLVTWSAWIRPDGEDVNVELIGLNWEGAGGPWRMRQGALRVVHKPETVVVDELYRDLLQVLAPGDTAQLRGRQVIIGGFSEGVRSFAGSPHVFTSLKQALVYEPRYRADEITYVMVRCRPNADINAVQADMRRDLGGVEILSSDEFAQRTARHWMLETGAGVGVTVTALLGLLVGAVITSQTLFAITQENLANYATLMAVGFETRLLSRVVVLQSLLVGVAGIGIGTLLFAPVSALSHYTPLLIAFYPPVFAALIVVFLIICMLASGLSLRSVFRLDPVVVFSQQ